MLNNSIKILLIKDIAAYAVLLDLELPDSRGIATLTRLQEANVSQIPVLVVTAMKDDALRVEAL